jgi:uncharacterized protein YcbX
MGRLVEIRRFPIKSMRGEILDHAEVDASGLVMDRAHAVVDAVTGKVARSSLAWTTSSRLGHINRPRPSPLIRGS